MGKDPRNSDTIDPSTVEWHRVGNQILPRPRESGAPSEHVRRPGESNSSFHMRQPEFVEAHQLGDCKDCGRREDHKWHSPGHATIGDGQQPHRYNPEGSPFERLPPA